MPWLATVMVAVGCLGFGSTQRVDPLLQFKTLKEFYDTLGGPNWKNNTGWLDGPPCGKDWRLPGNTPWHGLICNMDNGVTSINLINHGLKGPLPESLFTGLPALERLNIGQNGLTGVIPRTICQAKTLLTFSAQLNRNLGGKLPECLTSLPLIEEIILEMTAVSGPIPTVPFPKIKVLILSNSRFHGTIPDIWQSMAELRVLALNGCSGIGSGPQCKLHGPIPPSMYTLPNLFLWSLQQNNLNGTLREFTNMKKLRELHLNDNKLTGDIPESLYAQLAKPVPHENATRGMLHLENNRFTGRLLRKMEHLKFVKEVGVCNNRFTGYPPRVFHDLTQKDALEKWGEKWELFPMAKEALAKIPWLPGLPPWAAKMGAKSQPFQVSRVSPTVLATPVIYGNGSYYGPTVWFIGSGFVELTWELRCAFFRPDIKVRLGDPCNGVPPGSPDGVPECVMTGAKLWNSTHIECKPAALPGILGPVSAAVLFDGDDLNDVKNTTHVISAPRTLIIYDPFPVITSIAPKSGRLQGCTQVTVTGKHFVDTKQLACWFNETRVDGVFVSPTAVVCPSPPLWDPDLIDTKLELLVSPTNGSSFAVFAPGARPADFLFSYHHYCDLQPHSGLMGQPNCECGMCPCSSAGKCILNASQLAKHEDDEEFVLTVTEETEDDEGLHFPLCLCLAGFAGGNCSDCAAGHFGDTCKKCDCVRGTCRDGRERDGGCQCPLWWSGARCEIYYRTLALQASVAAGALVFIGLVLALRARLRAAPGERTPLMGPRTPAELAHTDPSS